MSNPFAESSDEVPESQSRENPMPPQPRLQIIHLMLWIAGTSILLGTWRNFSDEFPANSVAIRILMLSQLCVLCPLLGAAVASLGAWVHRAATGIPFPIHPGQWILVTVGVTALLQAGQWSLLRAVFDTRVFQAGESPFLFWMLSITAIALIEAAMYVIATVRVSAGRSWKLFLGTKAADALVTGLQQTVFFFSSMSSWSWIIYDWLMPALGYATNIMTCVCFLLLMIAIVLDWRQQTARDWMHWLGVATVIGTTMMNTVWVVIATFFSEWLIVGL
jgi:hypothetical protein